MGTVNNRYYAVIQRNKGVENMYGIEIECKYFEPIESLDIYFHNIEVDMKVTDFSMKHLIKASINRFMLLLPKIATSGCNMIEELSLYYIIDSEWNELDEKYLFKKPQTPGCIY